jgi:hypothetical protein
MPIARSVLVLPLYPLALPDWQSFPSGSIGVPMVAYILAG